MQLFIFGLCFFQWFIQIALPACSDSYIGYSIERDVNWIETDTSFVVNCDECYVNLTLPFTFSFFGRDYTQIKLTTNGFLSFTPPQGGAPTITGESIWVWWVDYYTVTSAFATKTVGVTPERIYAIELNGLNPKSPPHLHPGPDKCSTSLVAQVRLYEEDYHIEIEVYSAPLYWDKPYLAGIHSDLAGSTIHLFPEMDTTTGPNGWRGPLDLYTGYYDRDPGWTNTLCPLPFAARFQCWECTDDTECELGVHDCLDQTMSCNTLTGTCEQPNHDSTEDRASTIIIPSDSSVSTSACKYSYGCCPLGPQKYLPPESYITNCLEKDCLDTINSYLCISCQPIIPGTGGYGVILLNSYQAEEIEYYCVMPDETECGSSVFDWPNFPFVKVGGCAESVTLTDSSGTITDGSGSYNYLSPTESCEWNLFIDEIGYWQLTFNEFDLDFGSGDYIKVTDNSGDFFFADTLDPFAKYSFYSTNLNIYFYHVGSGPGFDISYEFKKDFPSMDWVFIFGMGNVNQSLMSDEEYAYVAPQSEETLAGIFKFSPLPFDSPFDPTNCFILPYDGNSCIKFNEETLAPEISYQYCDNFEVYAPDSDGLFYIYSVPYDQFLSVKNGSLVLDTNVYYWTFSRVFTDIEPCSGDTYLSLKVGDSGYITDNSGPLVHPSGPTVDCYWYLTLPICSIIEIEVVFSDLPFGSIYYSTEIEDGNLEYGDKTSFSNTKILVLNFYYSPDTPYQGFKVRYNIYPGENCGSKEDSQSWNDIICPMTVNKTLPNTVPCSTGGIYVNTTNYNETYMGIIEGSSDFLEDWSWCIWRIYNPKAKQIILSVCYVDIGEFSALNFYPSITPNDEWEDYFIDTKINATDDIIRTGITELSVEFYSNSEVSYSFKLVWFAIYDPKVIGCPCDYECYQNVDGNWTCLCAPGFTFSNQTHKCVDINECEIGLCKLPICINTEGSYRCECNSTSIPDLTKNYCLDRDECATHTHSCSQICIDKIGGYDCRCQMGFISTGDDQHNCTEITSSTHPWVPSVNITNFCSTNNNHLDLQLSSYEGSRTKTNKRCQFPFSFKNVNYTRCITEGYDKLNTETAVLPWCATVVDNSRVVLDWDICSYDTVETNLAQKSIFVSTASYPPIGILQDNEYTSAMELYWDYIYIVFPDLSYPNRIVLYNCPSCYDETIYGLNYETKFYVKCKRTFSTPGDILATVTFTPKVENVSIDLLGTGPCQMIEIDNFETIFLTEVQLFDNSERTNTYLDCALKLSRNYYTNQDTSAIPAKYITGLNSTIKNEINNLPATVTFGDKILIDRNIKLSFAFSITPLSSDIFSIFLGKNPNSTIGETNPLEIHINIVEATLTVKTVNDQYSVSINNLTLSDGRPHVMGIVYELGDDTYPRSSVDPDQGGRLTIFIDSDNNKIIDKQSVDIESDEYHPKFSCSATQSLKRQTSTTNEFRLFWVDISQEKFSPIIPPPAPILSPEENKTGLIVGVIVAVLFVIGLIIFLVLFFLRNKNVSVDLLPRQIKKNYLHYTRFPLMWEKRGEGASLSFVRPLKNDTKDMNKLLLLWEFLGGSIIEIEDAFAVHSPNQLINFANKWNSTMTQVRNNPKLFINQNWKENGEDLRLWVHEQYSNKVKKYSWNDNLMVPIIPALHGTDENVAYSIITTSFVALAKGDAGYYGKGLYFTTSAEYALPYFATKPSPTVLICYLISGNSYPVIEHPKSSKNLMGSALMPNYQSHYVLCRIDGMPVPHIMETTSDEPYYDEIVIEQESAVVPFYLLKIKRDNLVPLAMEIQKRQEKLVREDDHDSTDFRTSGKNRSTKGSNKGGKLREDEIGRSRQANNESARNNRIQEPSDSSSSEEMEVFKRMSHEDFDLPRDE